MKNVMIDLETVGNTPGCAIVSIGAVMFDEVQGLGAEFSASINLESAVAGGLHMDPSTVLWWLDEKKADARKSTFMGTSTLREALTDFSNWMLTRADAGVRVWGCGSDFDNVLLSAAYRVSHLPAPWEFYNNRCYRTLKALFPSVKIVREGTHHDALSDARDQAAHAVRLLRMLNVQRNLVPESVKNEVAAAVRIAEELGAASPVPSYFNERVGELLAHLQNIPLVQAQL